jgi:hypothetical protein
LRIRSILMRARIQIQLFHFNIDPVPAFHFNLGPEPGPAKLQSDTVGLCDHWPIDPPGLYFEPASEASIELFLTVCLHQGLRIELVD